MKFQHIFSIKKKPNSPKVVKHKLIISEGSIRLPLGNSYSLLCCLNVIMINYFFFYKAVCFFKNNRF